MAHWAPTFAAAFATKPVILVLGTRLSGMKNVGKKIPLFRPNRFFSVITGPTRSVETR